MLRHERMTVAVALAEFSHHSSRGQRMARAGVWGHEQNYTAKVRKPPTPQPELFSLEEEPAGACQHLCLRSLAGRTWWCGTSWMILAPSAWERLPVRADSRSSCAADGGQRDGRLADSGSPDGRAGYRSAQDFLLTVSFSFSFS